MPSLTALPLATPGRYVFVETHDDMAEDAHVLTRRGLHAAGFAVVEVVLLPHERCLFACRSAMRACMDVCHKWTEYSAGADAPFSRSIVCNQSRVQ